jgi:predicted nucleotidyltransferase
MNMQFKKIKSILTSHQKRLASLGTRHLSIFGSVARGDSGVRSDIDVLVDFDSKKGLFGFVDLKLFLEEILGSKVDLVSTRALHPALKKRIVDEAKQIF